MIDRRKTTPRGGPPIFQELEEQVQRAATDPGKAEYVRVKMVVDGGVEEEKYRFRFVASTEGEVECEMTCRLSDRNYETQTEKLSQKRLAKLFGAIDIPALVEARRPDINIPPCSLVGRLEVSNGEQTVTAIFMADAGQANTAGYSMPPALAEAAEVIYDLSAKQLGAKKVRP